MPFAVHRPHLNRQDIVTFSGVSGLYLFCFSGGFSTAGINIGLWLMIFAFLADRRWVALGIHKTVLARIVAVFTAYVLLRAGWTLLEFPNWQESILDDAKEIIAIGGLGAFVAAWWLHRGERNVYIALSLGLAGLVIGFLYNLDWSRISEHMTGLRATFNLGNNGPGLYGSAAVLGLIVFGLPAVWRSQSVYRYLGALVASVLAGILLVAIFWNQSRSSWLAAVLVVPIALFSLFLVRRRSVKRRTLAAALASALVVFTVVAVFSAPVIEKRLHQERRTMNAVINLRLDDVPRTSIGNRIYMWRFGAGLYAERPAFGWGPGTTKMLMKSRGFFPVFGHFHNIYVHFLVELGLVGFALAGGIVILFLRNLVQRNDLGARYLIFTLGAASMFVIASLFQIRYDDPHGMFYMIFLGALMLSGFYSHRPSESSVGAPISTGS